MPLFRWTGPFGRARGFPSAIHGSVSLGGLPHCAQMDTIAQNRFHRHHHSAATLAQDHCPPFVPFWRVCKTAHELARPLDGMRLWTCDMCKTSFVRQTFLDAHRGTRTCVRRQMKNLGLKMATRGLGSGGNLKRTVRRRIAPFVLYLKDNLRLCRKTRGEAVPVVPYDVTKVSSDFAKILSGIRQEFRKQHLNPRCKRQRASVMATCFANASTMTARGVQTIGVVPVPCSQAFEAALVKRAMTMHARRVQIFNTGMLFSASRSVVNKGKREAQKKLRQWAHDVRLIADKVGTAMERWPGLSPGAQPDKFLTSLGSAGFPAWGYCQHLGQNLWNCGFAGAHGLELKTERLLPLGGGRGPIGAIARILGSENAKPEVVKNPGYVRYCVHEICSGVESEWRKHGAPIRRDKRSLPDEHDIIIAQLCEWERAGFGIGLAKHHKMIDRFG